MPYIPVNKYYTSATTSTAEYEICDTTGTADTSIEYHQVYTATIYGTTVIISNWTVINPFDDDDLWMKKEEKFDKFMKRIKSIDNERTTRSRSYKQMFNKVRQLSRSVKEKRK